MLQMPFFFPERDTLPTRGRLIRDRQRQFEARLARSFAEMRARKQTA